MIPQEGHRRRSGEGLPAGTPPPRVEETEPIERSTRAGTPIVVGNGKVTQLPVAVGAAQNEEPKPAPKPFVAWKHVKHSVAEMDEIRR